MDSIQKAVSTGIENLTRSMEEDLFGLAPQTNLKIILHKLGIKSAAPYFSNFAYKSLSATLSYVTFDASKLVLWKDVK